MKEREQRWTRGLRGKFARARWAIASRSLDPFPLWVPQTPPANWQRLRAARPRAPHLQLSARMTPSPSIPATISGSPSLPHRALIHFANAPTFSPPTPGPVDDRGTNPNRV